MYLDLVHDGSLADSNCEFHLYKSKNHLFVCRNGLTADTTKMSFAEMMTDDAQTSREERCFRLWINSLGIATYVNSLFEDVRNG